MHLELRCSHHEGVQIVCTFQHGAVHHPRQQHDCLIVIRVDQERRLILRMGDGHSRDYLGNENLA